MATKIFRPYRSAAEDAQAAQYFASLPDYVQETMRERSGRINSLLSLRDYAENLTRGDN